VLDETIYKMTEDEWLKINELHKEYQGKDENKDDPNWINRLKFQAETICGLFQEGIINTDAHSIDYGCGDGKLAEFINEEYERRTNQKLNHLLVGKYDKYMKPQAANDYYSDEDLVRGAFDFVVSCSVFEHLIGEKKIDALLSLANDKGIIAIHTLVCDEVPCDPEWYYLLPYHCTLWTNKAMKKLYKEYKYVGCAYHVEARMWFFFKDKEKYEKLQNSYKNISGTWVFSEDFVDYWKQKPYR